MPPKPRPYSVFEVDGLSSDEDFSTVLRAKERAIENAKKRRQELEQEAEKSTGKGKENPQKKRKAASDSSDDETHPLHTSKRGRVDQVEDSVIMDYPPEPPTPSFIHHPETQAANTRQYASDDESHISPVPKHKGKQVAKKHRDEPAEAGPIARSSSKKLNTTTPESSAPSSSTPTTKSPPFPKAKIKPTPSISFAPCPPQPKAAPKSKKVTGAATSANLSGSSSKPATTAIARSKSDSAATTSRNKSKDKISLAAAAALKKALTKMTFPQYAEYIRTNEPERGGKTAPSGKGIFKDMTIFFVANAKQNDGKAVADAPTRGRMDFMRKNGAEIAGAFDPSNVTHIITNLTNKASILAVLGPQYKKLEDVPENIPILSYDNWLLRWFNNKNKTDVTVNDVFYLERHEPRFQRERDLARARARTSSSRPSSPAEFSVIKDFSDRSSEDGNDASSYTKWAVSSDRGGDEAETTNPLDRWAEIAETLSNGDLDSDEENPEQKGELPHQTQMETGGGIDSDDGTDDETDPYVYPSAVDPKTKKSRGAGYSCNDVGAISRGEGPNDDIIQALLKLGKVHESRTGDDDKWKVMQYNKASASLRRHPTRIRTLAEASSLRGIGKKTAEKIMELVNSGSMRRLEYEQNTEVSKVCGIFTGIYGVGPSVALDWYQHGLRTLEDVRTGKGGIVLSASQQIGLKYYDDLQDRMPRDEAKEIFDKIRVLAQEIDPYLVLDIMGSYRRGQDNCGDIDILVTRPDDDGRTHRGILRTLLPKLHKAGILTEDLSRPGDLDDQEAKYMGLCQRGWEGRMRRIDILTIPYEQWGAALIYFTGDDIFNRSMRLLARHNGLSLNQRGLWAGVIRDKQTGLKTTTGTIIASRTEREIFDKLGVPWQEPHERRRGR